MEHIEAKSPVRKEKRKSDGACGMK